MTSPPARGLFHRAIQESGPIIREMTTLRDAEHAGEELAADLQAPPGAAAIKYLRTLPAEQIQRAFATKRAPVAPALSIIDGWVIPSDPAKIFAEGGEFALPVLLGTNAQEMPGPDSGTIRSEIAAAYGANADKAIAYYGLNGSPEGNIDPLYGSASFQFSADVRQRCALIQEAVWHSARYPVYHYQLDHPIPGQPATHHSSELPYVFGNFPITGNLGGPYTSSDRALSDLMQSYWTNFARQGDPNGAGLQHWPRFDPKQRAFMEFTDGGPVASSGLRRDICELLMQTARQRKGIADAMGGQ
jgi:para-nitrobenzyl esterase